MIFIDRLAGVAGLGAAVYLLFLPGCVCDLWMPPVGMDVSPGDPTSKLMEAFTADGGASARVGAYFGLLAIFLLVVFFARLYGALRDASPATSWFPMLAMSGGVLLAGFLLIENGLKLATSELGALPFTHSHAGETEVARFFVLWGWNSAGLAAPPFAMALTGTTAVAFSSGVFPT